jgi:anaerobic selenocysteine-containing dehydrogenase
MDRKGKNITDLIAFNRRNFIKLVLGGAVGTAFAPIPWKMADDSTIWTQNWPWLPVPPVGAVSQANTVCQLCPGGCGIEVRKIDQRAVKIEGRPDYPTNPGGICPLGSGGLQLLYNENIRHRGPMKRMGPRGSGEFAAVSWDQALQEVVDRLADLRRQGRPQAVVAVDGNPARSSMALLIKRFMEAFGSPNYTRIPDVEDTYALVNLLMEGYQGPMSYDLENADFVLSFGCGLLEGWGAPGRVLNAWSLWRGGPRKGKTTVVQIEARASNTASKADQWLAVRPGSEAALALGLAHVIIAENIYDKDFVEYDAFGFEDWIAEDGRARRGFRSMVLERYAPTAVAKATGLDADLIVAVAKGFAEAKAPIALCGKGKGNLSGDLYEFMAVQSLNALVGNINQPGGVSVHRRPLPEPWPEIEPNAIASEGLKSARLDQAGTKAYPFSGSLAGNLADTILTSIQSPVDTVLVFSANPAYTLPDGGAFRSALKKVPFIVSFSPFKDETAAMADLILPDHVYLEKTDDVVWPTGLPDPFYALTQPVVEPLYDTRHSGETLIRLAKMLQGSVAEAFPWKDYEDVLKARAKGLFESGRGQTGDSPFEEMWRKLAAGGFWYQPHHDQEGRQGLFQTPSGKFEFFSQRIEAALGDLIRGRSAHVTLREMGLGDDEHLACMPHYIAPEAAAEEGQEEYPLLLLPYDLINISSGWLPNPPYLYKTLFDHQLREEDSFVELNPETAAKYNLKQGDRIVIESARTTLKARLNLFAGAMPEVVFIPAGLGHTAYDAYQRDKGVNPNDIIAGGNDRLSGHLVWWNTRVRVKKA